MSKILELLQRIEAPSRNVFEMPRPVTPARTGRRAEESDPAAAALESAPVLEGPEDEAEPGDAVLQTRLIPIASGKGGVGKTNVAVNLSIALADRLREKGSDDTVILVDCDFGLPNADIILGAHQSRTIDDFVARRIGSLSDAVSSTGVTGLNFLSGAATPSMTLSNLQYQQRRKFLRNLRALQSRFVVLDLGASVHFEVLDFFSMVNSGLVVTNPEPTAMRDSFLFIRATLLRKLRQESAEMPMVLEGLDRLERGAMEIPSVPGLLSEIQRSGHLVEYKSLRTVLDAFRPKLIVNRAEDFNEALEVARKMREEARRELGIEIAFLGPVLQDACVVRAVKDSAPFLRRFPECDAAHWIRNIAQRVEDNNDFEIERNYFSFGSYLRRLFGARGAAGLS